MIIVVKDPMLMAFMTKNMTNGLCNESDCTIVMVVINVLYDYKCSHNVVILFTFWCSASLILSCHLSDLKETLVECAKTFLLS
jgi:hypothetical protein